MSLNPRTRKLSLVNSLSMKAAACLAVALVCGPAMAEDARTRASDAKNAMFLISDQEGYGTGECLERQGGCGKVIADSFCESKGYKGSAFHRKANAGDVTGSLDAERRPPPRDPQAFVIACR